MELQRQETRGRLHELERMVDNAKRASDLLKALAHESRLVILCILAEGENAKDDQPAFVRERLEEIAGALGVVDHSFELVQTAAGLLTLQFHGSHLRSRSRGARLQTFSRSRALFFRTAARVLPPFRTRPAFSSTRRAGPRSDPRRDNRGCGRFRGRGRPARTAESAVPFR